MDPHAHIDLLRRMLRIRLTEEAIAEVYPQGMIRTPTHLSIGQEAVAVGICSSLTREDQLFCSHRSHAPYLAKGGNLERLMAELFGRETGCSRGRGGSVHLIDTAAGMMGSSAILGGGVSLAVGAAFAFSRNASGHAAVAFFGDAVMEEGVIWECFNLALLYQLPVLFVCENNQYSTNTHLRRRQGGAPIKAKVAGLGMSAELIDGNDVVAVASYAIRVLPAVRSGIPHFVEASTYRIREHVGPLFDHLVGIRPAAEVEQWMVKCPIKRLRQDLRTSGVLPDEAYLRLETEIKADVTAALSFAECSPWPDPAEMLRDVY